MLSRLLSRGLLAAQAPRGVRKADILVNFLEGGKPCLIQVKSRQFGSDGGWHMSEKHEAITDPDLFYCFVDFEPEHPAVHVLPASLVASVLKLDHEIWLAKPGAKGQAHNPTTMRRFRASANGQQPGWLSEYVERWDLISSQSL